MVDVHVAHLPGEHQGWWNTCETSLAQHNVCIHHIDGIIGDIRQTRYNGFLCGDAEYVSFVDPDDVVLPESFAVLEAALDNSPLACGAYSLSEMMTERGEVKELIHPYRKYTPSYLNHHMLEIHQLVVMRRSHVLQIMKEHYDTIPPMGYTEIVLYALMAEQADWVAVNHVGYQWRMQSKGAHHLNPPTQQQRQSELLRSLHRRILSARQPTRK